ncbi:MAG: MocR-like transcription factor YczR [Nocardioidaceae bacterium]
MTRTISATRVATLLGSAVGRSPAYLGIADGIRLLLADGRVAPGTRLPSERELTGALGVSRTTVTRAYAHLREHGYVDSRRGSGSVTRLPERRAAVEDHVLHPGDSRPGTIDLTCAASAAPPGVAAAYEAAVAALPSYLSGTGYYPTGLPALREALAQRYAERGLPTTADQIVVTAGALAGIAVTARAFSGTGDRLLVESPTYPNAIATLRRSGRVVGAPVDPEGWDVEALTASLRQTAPRLAYLVPDVPHPTGALMSDPEREEVGAALTRARTLTVVDETLVDVALDAAPAAGAPDGPPLPMAAHVPDSVSVGSASKAFWGGLRVGWLRAPERRVAELVASRLTLDLGAPLLEQLVLVELLRRRGEVLAHQHERLRARRDVLVAALAGALPDWRFRVPRGGLALWCALPEPLSTALTVAAERHGVLLAPGGSFAPEGGLERFVRIPYTRSAEELTDAVDRLALAWQDAQRHRTAAGGRSPLIA